MEGIGARLRTAARLVLAACLTLTAALVGSVAAAPPAGAALPDVWAFAYMDDPAPGLGAVLDLDRQSGTFRTTCGGVATARESGLGIYEVSFPCSAAPTPGVVHITTVDDSGRYCTVGSWGASGGTVAVTVFCFDQTGHPDRARFTVLYTSSSGVTPGYHAYVYSDFTGAVLTSFNSTGAANSVTRVGTGAYEVKIPGLSWWQYTGNLQVNAVHPNQTATRCKIANWSWTGPDYAAVVTCVDRGNAPADTWWTLSFHNLGTVYGTSWPTRFGYLWFDGATPVVNFNSSGASNSIAPVGTGDYLLSFPGLGVAPTHMQVATFGNGPGYCQLSRPWDHTPPDLVAKTVICFDGLGGRADSGFFATAAAHTP